MRKLKLDELNRLSTDEFAKSTKLPVVLVLDNIRSALNVGSIFRSSDGFRIDHIYLCGITAKPPHKEINKTAIGATNSVSWSYHENINDVIELLSSENCELLAIEQTNKSISLEKFNFEKSKKYALILGNEVEGVSDETLMKMDHCIEIPQFGTKHSFNVSVCLGIILWEAIRQIKLSST